MSIVINGSEHADLNIASSYLDYLKIKSGEMAEFHKKKYQNDLAILHKELAREKLELELKFNNDLDAYEKELKNFNYTQMQSLIEHMEDELTVVIDKVLSKLGSYSVASTQISDLIRVELSDLLKSRTVNVKANADTINYLKFCVEVNDFINEYEEDNNIKDGTCIISDGMCTCVANIAEAVKKIKTMFKKD